MAQEATEISIRLPSVTVMRWNEFARCPGNMYNLFQPVVNSTGTSPSWTSNVVSLTGIKEERILHVDTVEELHKLTCDLLNKPILFRATPKYSRTDSYVVYKVRKTFTDTLAVLVNTRDPKIREGLTDKLTEAMQYMEQGKKFCLKFDFSESLKRWYADMLEDGGDGLYSYGRSSTVGGMGVWVTNYDTPNDFCTNPVVWCCLFPFWLLFGGPCYMIHRSIKCIDSEHSFPAQNVVMKVGAKFLVAI